MSKTFIEDLTAETGFEKKACEDFLEAFTTVLEEAVVEGDVVSLPAFGTFESKKKNERIMSHPSVPGKRLLVPPKIVISYKASATLKNKLNK